MSVRHERLESVIHRGVQSVISEGFADPRLEECILTVLKVSVDRDLTTAVIGVSVLPEKAERRAIAGLNAAARHIRRETADRVNVHRMPQFRFKVDVSAKRQRGVLEALAKARAEFDDGTPSSTQVDPADAAQAADLADAEPHHDHDPEKHQ